jgi:hypothetical protein
MKKIVKLDICFYYCYRRRFIERNLSDVLNFVISICLKLIKEFEIFVSFDNFMEEESIATFDLGFLALNIKKKIVLF